jgi:hypothetical protein
MRFPSGPVGAGGYSLIIMQTALCTSAKYIIQWQSVNAVRRWETSAAKPNAVFAARSWFVTSRRVRSMALETSDCILITADERYLRAARSKGNIVSLMEWK